MVFIIILIITIVVINYILSGNKNQKDDKTTSQTNRTLATTEEEKQSNEECNMEKKLEKILSTIKGVGEVNVLITYSQTSQIIPIYNEDNSQTTTKENNSGGETKVTDESTNKKEVIYEENNGDKTLMTQSVINPIIEGAIVTAKGASNANIKASIIQAVEAATGLATHKIQVFEMN